MPEPYAADLSVVYRRLMVKLILIADDNEDGALAIACSLGARSFLSEPCQIEDVRNPVRSYPAYWETEMRKESVAATSNECADGAPFASVSP